MWLSATKENLVSEGRCVCSADGRLDFLRTAPGLLLGARLFHAGSACPDPTARLPGGAVQLRLHKGAQPRVLLAEGGISSFPEL